MQIGGKELRITPAPFADAIALQKSIGKALKDSRFDIPASVSSEITSESLSDIIRAILNVAISDEVESAMFKCAERALLGTEKINRDFFEIPENRQHYFPIAYEIIMVNVAPFFSGLSSKFSTLINRIEKDRK